jgi:methylated-DNA-[protein]-cysteine S-methyltransferase
MRTATSCASVDSPVGRIHLAANENGLTHLLFADHTSHQPEGDGSVAAASILAETERQLSEYFAGQRRTFELPLAPAGTEFQQEVWRSLREIPYGQTISYAELARRIGRPKAVRAVGAANGANPIAIIVPCHRVIGAGGRLTGYGGGLSAKRTLLELEGVSLEGD